MSVNTAWDSLQSRLAAVKRIRERKPPDALIGARTLALTLLDRMESPLTTPPCFQHTPDQSLAWQAGYRAGLSQARAEIAMQATGPRT